MKQIETQEYKDALMILEDKMDLQQNFKNELWTFHDKYGTVPPEYDREFTICRVEGKRTWRQRPQVVKRLHKTAKKLVQVGAKISYLSKEYKQDAEDIRKLFQSKQDWKLVLKELNNARKDKRKITTV